MSESLRLRLSDEEIALLGLKKKENNRYYLSGERLKKITEYREKKNHSALSEYCAEKGIPFDSVRYYWHKGKHFSVNSRVDSPDIQVVKDAIIAEMTEYAPKYPKYNYPKHTDPHLLVIDPADIHIGKLCDAFETGEEYDSQIAVQRVIDGVSGILAYAAGYQVERILLVAGNDVLHVDTPRSTTTSGTPQDSSGMWYTNFIMARRMMTDVIEMLAAVAPVTVVFNPSNHDFMSGFQLMDAVSCWFHRCSDVTFDADMKHRKYFVYHENLIGTTHGDGAKTDDLPMLMAQEAKQHWSTTTHRYWYTHHVHHKTMKDKVGVTIESMRSPSGIDGWHHRNGYQHAPKAIEGFIHHPLHGQVARLTKIF
jgi:hypothetical protein